MQREKYDLYLELSEQTLGFVDRETAAKILILAKDNELYLTVSHGKFVLSVESENKIKIDYVDKQS